MNLISKPTMRIGLSVLYLVVALAVVLNPIQVALAKTTPRSLQTPAALGCWYSKADMPTARRALAAVELDGKIFVIGGRDGERYDVVERYDPATDTWATMAPMLTERAWLVAAAVNGKIYAIGGSNTSGKLGNVEEYNPGTNTWTTKTPMPTARDDAVVGVVDGKIYVIGGWNVFTRNEVEEYDPLADTWTTKTPMPDPRAMASSAVVNGKIYVIGGLDGNVEHQATNFEYYPSADTWSEVPGMPTTTRSRLAAGVVNDLIYVIGGYNPTLGWLRLVERYNPSTDQWATMNSMPTKRGGLAAAVAGGLIYAFGGRSGPILSVTEAVDFACTNNPPDEPSDPNPGGGWTNRPLTTSLSWTGSDPDPGDTLTYDVYLGESLTPPLVSSGQSDSTYDPPGLLDPHTSYYWRVVARDNHGAVTSGPCWRFKTAGPGDLIKNGSFETDLSHWDLKTSGPAVAYLTRDDTVAAEGSASAKVSSSAGTLSGHVLVSQDDLTLVAGRSYNFSFWAMAFSAPCPIEVVLRMSSDPWTQHFYTSQNVTPRWQWQRYEFDIVPAVSDPNATLEFSVGLCKPGLYLDGIHLVDPPIITASKTADPSNLSDSGGTVEFTTVITNHTGSAVTLTSLVDDVYGDITNGSNPNLESTNCELAVIPASDSYECAFQTQVTEPGVHTDTVTAAVEDLAGSTSYAYADATVTVTDVIPVITVEKTANPSSLDEPGGAVEFTVRVDNTGVETAILTSLVDDVYGDITNASNPNLESTTCALSTVPVGGFYQCSFQAQVSGDPGYYADTVTATASDDENNSVQAADTVTVTITNIAPAINVIKSADPVSIAEPGGTVEFTVQVQNTGFEAVTLVSMQDDVYGDIADASNPDLLSSTCELVSIPASGSYTCAFRALVSGEPGVYVDTVTVTARDNESDSAVESDDATVLITDLAPSIAVTKTANPTSVPKPGGTVQFTVRVDNIGFEAVTLVSMVDDVYGDITNASNLNLESTTCALSTVPVGGFYQCSFQAQVSGAPGAYTDTVGAIVEDAYGSMFLDSDDAVVTITDVEPIISVSKTADPTVIRPGDSVAFTIRVYNQGVNPVTLTDLDDTVFGDLANGCSLPVDIAAGGLFECVFARAISADHINTVTATAEDSEGTKAADSAYASVDVISLIFLPLVANNHAGSAVNRDSADDPPGVLNLGTRHSLTIAAGSDQRAATSRPRGMLKPTGLEDKIKNGGFETDLSHWMLKVHSPGEASLSRDDTTAGEGSASAKIDITEPATWFGAVQLWQDGIPLLKGQSYTLSFWAKASVERPIEAQFRTTSAPWTVLAHESQDITTSWQKYEFVFTPEGSDADTSLVFSLGKYESTVWLDGISLVGPTITVTKAADPSSLPEPGGTVQFTVLVTNNSDAVTATLISLVDDVYGDLNGKGDCVTGGTIDPGGGTYTCAFQAEVSGEPGVFTDTVTAVLGDSEAHTHSVYADATVTVTDVLPSIEVDKTADPTSVPEPGGLVTFTVRVDNTSVEAVTLTSLVDDIHGDLHGQGDCSVPQSIAVGGYYECTFSAFVSGNPGDSETDTVTATVQDNEDNPISDDDSVTVDVTDVLPTISVDKTANPTILPEPGGTVEFTVMVTNTSIETATLTSLVDAPYGDLTDPLNTAIAKSTCATGGAIAANGGTYTCAFQAQVSGEPGEYTDTVTATVQDNEGSEASADGSATVTVTDVEPTIEVNKTANPTVVRAGDLVDFTVRVYNRGVESITLIDLDDTVFGSLTEECGLPVDIAVHDFFECVISRTISADHTNTITATAEDGEGSEATDSAGASVDVIDPTIQVVKEASVTTANVGESITYTYTVENTGDVTLTNVRASDDRLGAISLGSTTLASGEITTGSATYLATESDLPGPLTNTVTVTGTPPVGDDVTDSDTATVDVEPAPAPMDKIIYLPLIQNNHVAPAPDSVVERIPVTSSSVQVVLKNQGATPPLPMSSGGVSSHQSCLEPGGAIALTAGTWISTLGPTWLMPAQTTARCWRTTRCWAVPTTRSPV